MNNFPVAGQAKRIIETTPIEEAKHKYIFLVGNLDLCFNILSAGYRSICIENETDCADFISYMEEIAFKGTDRNEFLYVLCCEWKHNQMIKEYLEKDGMAKFHDGYSIFKNKESFRYESDKAGLVAELDSLIARYEPQEAQLILDEFHHMKQGQSGESGACSVFDSKIRNHLLRYKNVFVCGCPYVFKNGLYHADYSGTRLKAIIEKYLYPKFQKNNTINQIYNLIVNTDYIQRSFDDLNNYPETYINFQDCMLDVATMKEVPHEPQFFAINQLPYKWADIKKATSGKEIERFFDFIFTNEDDRKMLLQYVGLCFTKDTRQQRFLTLCGLGGTGKSVLIRLIEASVGRENISNVSLQELSRRFNTSLLVGKLLNSCADLSAEMLEDSSIMKKLLGEDSIFAERKGENGFMFRNYSKLLFSTNSLPIIASERTNGFYRRLLILKMDKQPEKVDTELFSKLLAELPYFINLAVQALHKMYADGGRITISKSSEEAVKQMWRDSDVVEAWLSDCCVLDKEAKTDRVKLFVNFERYCEQEGRQALTKNGFYKVLRNKNFPEIKLHGYTYIKGVSFEKNITQSSPKTSPDDFVEVTEEEKNDLPFD